VQAPGETLRSKDPIRPTLWKVARHRRGKSPSGDESLRYPTEDAQLGGVRPSRFTPQTSAKEFPMKVASDLKYTQNDEWVRVEGTTATAGITDYAQEQLSDIVFVEVVAAPGQTVAKGSVFANVESVKAAAEVYMPLSGTITAVNEGLPQTPEQVNKDPYGEAWMIRFTVANPSEVAALMDAAAYEKFCQERSH
jgi:glycine cleavage system H protein